MVTKADQADSTKLATGAGISMIGTMVGRGLLVLSQIVLARVLGPEAFGLYAIGFTLFRLVGQIAPLGLDQGTVRYATGYRHSDVLRLRGLLLQSLSLSFVTGLAMAVALFLCAPWLANTVFSKPDLAQVIRWFLPAFVFIAVLRVAVSATRVSQQMRYAVYAEHLVQPAVNLLLIFVFFLVGWKLTGAVAALGISFFLSVVLALYYVKRLFPEAFSKRGGLVTIPWEVVSFSLLAAFGGFFAALNTWVDRLMVGHFRPAAEVGVYQAVSQFSIAFATIIGAFNMIFAPMVADHYHGGRIRELDELFKTSTKWGLYMSVPLFLAVCCAPHELLVVAFGVRYESGALPLVILAIGQLINVGSGSVGLMMVMTGHQKGWLLISGFALVANVTLNALLVPRFGLAGAATATAIALSGLFLLGLIQVKRHVGIWPYDRRYLKGLFAAALTSVALLGLRWMNIDVAVLNVTLTLMVSFVVFFAGLALCGLDTEDRQVVQALWALKRRFFVGREAHESH